METIIGTTTVSDLSFAKTLAAALDPFTETGWMTEETSNKCWDTIKEMASSYQLPRQESEEEEEDSAMAALMRSTGEEIEENCRLVKDVTSSQKAKRETIIRFEELFEKWKSGEPIEQIQAGHDERLLECWSNLSRIPKAAGFSRVTQVVLSCHVTSTSSSERC